MNLSQKVTGSNPGACKVFRCQVFFNPLAPTHRLDFKYFILNGELYKLWVQSLYMSEMDMFPKN